MLGEVEKENLVRTAGVQVGDDVILSKGVAIEGTAVLAREMAEVLAAQVGDELVQRGKRFLTEPGISVMRDAAIVCRAGLPHAMHDPTEGGLATGLWELAHASGKGIVVDRASVPIYPETVAFCQALNLDPLGLIASGALVATASPDDSSRMVTALVQEGIDASVIGRVVEGPPLVWMETREGVVPVPIFEQDELTRLFANEE
jgi:hydrogenase maturation factor